MKNSIWLRVIAIALVVGFLAAVAPYASEPVTYDPMAEVPTPTKLEKVLTKLGRGISNIALGWAEVPVTMKEKFEQGKPLGYLLAVAPVLGTARGIMRTSVGVYEVVTFPRSSMDVNYEAILQPEYIF